ncbi:MAG: response regulator [Oscillospiraceae bacterium]|jgi:CheY-like chemotaxis protein|nr:response regulator [Oscillospiraceae bacterium]
MQRILIVTETERFLLRSIKEKFENASYRVSVVRADTDAINQIKDTVRGVLIYADEALLEQQLALNFLKDRAIAYDLPVFTIGTQDALKGVRAIISSEFICKEFTRPINTTGLVEAVGGLIEQFSAQVKKKILAVDDSGVMLRSVKEWLGGKYNVFLANSAAMAIKYISLNRPDLVLLDYAMPVVDGKQVLEMIRTETELTDIPVIFLTALEDEESFLKVKGLRPEGYLLKTLSPQEIVAAVDEFFARKKSQVYLKNP